MIKDNEQKLACPKCEIEMKRRLPHNDVARYCWKCGKELIPNPHFSQKDELDLISLGDLPIVELIKNMMKTVNEVKQTEKDEIHKKNKELLRDEYDYHRSKISSDGITLIKEDRNNKTIISIYSPDDKLMASYKMQSKDAHLWYKLSDILALPCNSFLKFKYFKEFVENDIDYDKTKIIKIEHNEI